MKNQTAEARYLRMTRQAEFIGKIERPVYRLANRVWSWAKSSLALHLVVGFTLFFVILGYCGKVELNGF